MVSGVVVWIKDGGVDGLVTPFLSVSRELEYGFRTGPLTVYQLLGSAVTEAQRYME